MGRLAGIARHPGPRAPMEELSHARVTVEAGVEGDGRGTVLRKKGRQVALIEAEGWNAAMDELGLSGDEVLPWYVRRANLLVEGVRLPRDHGHVIAIGDSLRIKTTLECDPCRRMDEIRPGLRQALTPDWRGGVLGVVLEDGDIAVGDEVRIEE